MYRERELECLIQHIWLNHSMTKFWTRTLIKWMCMGLWKIVFLMCFKVLTALYLLMDKQDLEKHIQCLVKDLMIQCLGEAQEKCLWVTIEAKLGIDWKMS